MCENPGLVCVRSYLDFVCLSVAMLASQACQSGGPLTTSEAESGVASNIEGSSDTETKGQNESDSSWTHTSSDPSESESIGSATGEESDSEGGQHEEEDSETESNGDGEGEDEIGDDGDIDLPGDDCLTTPGPDCPCRAADLLFVIDNSVSMNPYQIALAEALPKLVATLNQELPAGISIHAGATSTEMGFSATGTTQDCFGKGADLYYQTPDEEPSDRPAAQGRLAEVDGHTYVEFSTGDDETTLAEAAEQFAKHVRLGTSGSNIEMSAACAGWAADPAVEGTNAGFFRDEGALLAVIVIQDEPDQTPADVSGKDMLGKLVARKQACGGLDCILGGGLVHEACLVETPLGEFFDAMTIPAMTNQLPGASEDLVGAIENQLFIPLAERLAEHCEQRNR